MSRMKSVLTGLVLGAAVVVLSGAPALADGSAGVVTDAREHIAKVQS